MKTNEQKAFDFAADTTKQLITLATGIIALTITFSKDIIGASELSNSSLIFWSWGLFIFSIFFGIWTLMALTGNLQPMKKNKKPDENEIEDTSTEVNSESCSININTRNVKIPSILQILSFILALVFTVLFGVNSIKSPKEINCNGDCIEVIKKTEYEIIKPKTVEKIKVKEQ